MPSICVEVVYALPERQFALALRLKQGATVRDAIVCSGVLPAHPEIDLAKADVGIWSQRVTLGHRLNDGDRVEIYRPLRADPKASRRQRVRQGAAPRRTGRG